MPDSQFNRHEPRLRIKWPVSIETADGRIHRFHTQDINSRGVRLQGKSFTGPGDHSLWGEVGEMDTVATRPPPGHTSDNGRRERTGEEGNSASNGSNSKVGTTDLGGMGDRLRGENLERNGNRGPAGLIHFNLPGAEALAAVEVELVWASNQEGELVSGWEFRNPSPHLQRQLHEKIEAHFSALSENGHRWIPG